ncbi:MAG: cob(I)yrinic acid a,c-diamide adenosyltransferase [Thermoguttaceae bacterium]|nr:cob(I)yrinic acid a,c-diamide adenosyltransferase [Thermoguttaceae bacterium]
MTEEKPTSSGETTPAAPKKVRIYSRRGDLGETSLFSGPRVGKDHPRIEAVGTVDELSCAIGLARSFGLPAEADEILERIQRKLIEVGTEITAMTPGRHAVPTIQPEEIRALEELIDSLSESLPPLTSFLIPGGTPPQAALQLARAVCRRAERALVVLLRSDPTFSRRPIAWFNRLGDLLFVLARRI